MLSACIFFFREINRLFKCTGMDSKTTMVKGIFHLEDKSVFVCLYVHYLLFFYFFPQKRGMEALMAFDVKFNAQLHA